jgi:hypothetical protein
MVQRCSVAGVAGEIGNQNRADNLPALVSASVVPSRAGSRWRLDKVQFTETGEDEIKCQKAMAKEYGII